MASPEYQAMIKCAAKLITALKGSLITVSANVLSAELIPMEVHEQMNNINTPVENRACTLVLVVTDSVKLNAGNFQKFIEVLTKNTLVHQDILNELQTTYRECSQSNPQLQSDAETVYRVLGTSFDSDNTGDTTAVAHTCAAVEPLVQQLQGSSLCTDHVVANELGQTDPIESHAPLLVSDTNCSQLYSDSEVKSQMEHFKLQFLSLQRQVLSELKQSRVEVDVIQDELVLLPVDIQEEHYYFIEHAITELENVGNLRRLFFHLNLYWNFFEFNLLEHIINCNGSTQLKERMKKYAEEMETFKQRTSVAQFKTFWPGKHEIPPHFSTVEVKLRINFNECTLAQLDKFRKELCRKARLLEFALILFDVKDGSVLFQFLLSRQLVPRLVVFRQENTEFLRSHNVVAMFIDHDEIVQEVSTGGKDPSPMDDRAIKIGWDLEDQRLTEMNTEESTSESDGGSDNIATTIMLDSEDNTPHSEGDGDDLSSDQELSLNYEEVIVWPDSDPPDDCDDTAAITTAGEEDPSITDNQGAINVRLAQKDQTLRLTEMNTRQSTSDVGSIDHISPDPLLLLNTNKYKPQFMDLILKSVLSGHKVATESVTMEMLKYCDPLEMYPKIGKQLLDFCNEDKESKVKVPPSFRHHSPLMIACEQENSDIVKILLERGASVAFKSKDRLTALHIACKNGNLQIVEMLLTAANEQKHFCHKKTFKSDREVALNTRNQRGWTPLMFAAAKGHAEIINMLVNTREVDFTKTTKKKCTAVHIAAGGGVESLKAVISALPEPDEANKDSQSNVCLATDKNGWNVLHHICAKGTLDSLKWLLNNVTKLSEAQTLNHQSKTGYTPLLVACEYQKKDIVEHLLSMPEVNVSLCAKDQNPVTKQLEGDKSGLHLAAIHEAPEIAEILIRNQCPIDLKDFEGNTALHTAYRKSSFYIIEILEKADNGRLKGIKNNDGLLPSAVTPEDIIPPEIIKRGKEAIARYKHALTVHGKGKIPRCSLLFLGQKRVGKTSVYRLLVMKGFNRYQESTKGIDNADVDTVDRREIGIDQWKEMKEGVQKEQSDHLHAQLIANACKLPPVNELVDPRHFKPIEEVQLIDELERIKESIKRAQMAEAEPVRRPRRPQPTYHDFDSYSTAPFQQLSEPFLPLQPTVRSSTKPEATVHPPRSTELKSPPPALVPKEKPQARTKEGVPLSKVGDTPQSSIQVAANVPSTPKPAPPIPPPPPRVSRRHRRSINKYLKSTDLANDEPSLILNALDFAGQKVYRPMHHCFIIRRAMYLVVFNLQEMLVYINLLDENAESAQITETEIIPVNPIEEIRYWLHSIHAHIYPPDEKERGRDKKMRRVCLVGTHRAPDGKEIKENDLKRIHKMLEEELSEDERCIDHIHYTQRHVSDDKRIFIAVENSMDRKEDREKSGAKALQDELKHVKGDLLFLDEDHPIAWLRFEEELIRLRETHKQVKLTKLEDLRQLAFKHGITDLEDQEQTFQFFHDIGKIVYFRSRDFPRIFLSEFEQKQLEDLVILDQSWLISVMREVIELEHHKMVPQSDIKMLEETGIASSSLLRECWSNFLYPEDKKSFRNLCLILQAHCLIYPVTVIDICNQGTEESSQEIDQSQESDGSPSKPVTEVESYLVPSKLPEVKTEKDRKRCNDNLPWVSFFFDFQKFLPAEIFHRLICLMLASIQGKRRKLKKEQFFYNSCCRFSSVEGCKWKIELEREHHRLKMSVISSTKDIKPEKYITTIHTKYLMPICQQSNLQGLEYYGGPLVKCEGCGETEVIEFTGYADGEDLPSKSECSKCGESCDIAELLKPPIKKAAFTKKSSAEPPLDLRSLTILRRAEDDQGKEPQTITIIESIAPRWKKAGILLDIPKAKLDSISTKYRDDQELCCQDVFSIWLENGSKHYESTWIGLFQLLRDMKYSQIAAEVEELIKSL